MFSLMSLPAARMLEEDADQPPLLDGLDKRTAAWFRV